MMNLRALFVATPLDVTESVAQTLRSNEFELELHDVLTTGALESVLFLKKWDVLFVSPIAHEHPVEQALDVLKRHEIDIPCIVLSSDENQFNLDEAIKLGAQDCVYYSDSSRLVQTVKRECLAASLRHNVREQWITDHLLQEIDQYILNHLDLSVIAERVCQRIAELFEFKLTCIGMRKPNGEVEMVAAAGATDYLIGMTMRWDGDVQEEGTAGVAIRENRPVVCSVCLPRCGEWCVRAEQFGLRSSLAIPLGIGTDVIGTLMMYSANDESFDKQAVKRLTAFAARVTVALLTAQEKQTLHLMEAAMNNAANSMFITNAEGFIVWMNDELLKFSAYSFDEVLGQPASIFSVGKQQSEYWLDIWETVQNGKPWRGDVESTNKLGVMHTVMQSITPLFNAQREIVNFLFVQQDISDRQKLEDEVHYLAYHDVLTDLPNRMLFQDRVQQQIVHAKRNKEKFAVVFIDLDGFKEVNDTRGHACGDKLLQTVAQRLRGCLREGDTVARLGGDEFTILLCRIEQGNGLNLVLRKIINLIAQPYQLGEFAVNVTASVGVSLYPFDASGVEKLLLNADTAMYTAKQAGKNRFVIYGQGVAESSI